MGPEHFSAPPLAVSGTRSRHVRRGWQFAALALILAGAGGLTWWLTGGATNTPPRASGAAVAPAQAQAAAWIAGQVSDSAIIACDPGLCPVLQEQGISPGRLLPLRAGASPAGADVLVTSGAADAHVADRYAPARIASSIRLPRCELTRSLGCALRQSAQRPSASSGNRF